MTSTWHIEQDVGVRRESLPASGGTTVSLAFIGATLRRLWYVWLGCTLLGAALAAGYLVLVPPQSVGTVSLLLAHDPSTQPDAAMATDVRLLKSRTVAQQLGDQLGSELSADQLLETILAQPATSSVLDLEISGSDPDDAVRRARLLADTYLGYREDQLSLQSDAVTQGYQERIDALQTQVDGLTRQYDVITSRGGSNEEVADVLALRGQLISEITQLQNEIETEMLESRSIVAASRVLDEPSLVPQSPLKRTVLAVGSGLVGGLGIGLGLVMVYAITTGRLRSRADVATAMGLPVMFSAGRLPAHGRRFKRRHAAALDLLVDGLESAHPRRGRKPFRLGLITVDCAHDGARVLAGLARRLAVEDSVLAVDLEGTGLVDCELGPGSPQTADGSTDSISVVLGAPAVTPAVDVVLTLVPFDIDRGLGHARSTATRCVVLVKSGASTTERLSSVARAARTAGLDVAFVMLVGVDSSDESYGGDLAVGRAQQSR